MIIKVLEPLYKVITIEDEDGNKVPTEVPGKIISKRMEINEITEFAEVINERTKKPYKKRCLLRSMDQWIIVNHSFDELSKMKDTPSRIVIKGFYGKTARRSYQEANRNSKKK
jgi:hypothetical protein